MKKGIVVIAAAVACLAASPASAQVGDFLVAPTRITFEGAQRSSAISIVNKGSEPATFRISWVQKRMSATGDLDDVEACGPDCLPASDLVRFSPREARLPPGGSQTVRIVLRKPAALPPGEYRSHLKVSAVPPAGAAGTSLEPGRDAAGGLRISLTPVYGISVPVIVRQGSLPARARLFDLKIVDAPGPERPDPARKVLELKIGREGERSIYGDLLVREGAAEGSGAVLARARGVAVYTPNAFRLVRMPLETRSLPRNGKLLVQFSERHDRSQENRVVSEVLHR